MASPDVGSDDRDEQLADASGRRTLENTVAGSNAAVFHSWTGDHRDLTRLDFYGADTMNLQGVGEICFEETYRVAADQTARSLFARLPTGTAYWQTLIDCLATGHVIAIVESICIREMQQHVDPATEVVVGRSLRIEHLAPVPPATRLRLRGWVERLGERSATFCVRAHDDHEMVFDGTVRLVAAQRGVIEPRIAAKMLALQAALSSA